MNIKQTINKLQKALIQRGHIYKIGTHQFYSKEQNRMITVYRVSKNRKYRKKNGKISRKDAELISSCSQADILKWFVEKWEEVKENE